MISIDATWLAIQPLNMHAGSMRPAKHTMASDARPTQAPKRRFYSPELKLQVVGACAQPGVSIAGVTMQHGINANIVHRCPP